MKNILEMSPFIVGAIGSWIIIRLRLKPLIKKRVIRIFAISWGICSFCLYLSILEESESPVLVFILPMIIWGIFGMIKYTKVCPECGHTFEFGYPYVKPKVCSKCGSELRYE